MAKSFLNEIKVDSVSVGTGSFVHGSAVVGPAGKIYLAPGSSNDGQTFSIRIEAVNTNGTGTGQWEICDSVFAFSTKTWTRGALHSSSTGSRIDFSAGTKHISIDSTAKDFARIGNFVDVANAASGTGTLADPWTGWDTAITWTANTTYRFRTGWYSFATSPVYALDNAQYIGESAVYLKHTGRGVAFDLNNPAGVSTSVNNIHIHNINLVGNYATGTGTIAYSSGTATVTGTGTAFTTQLQVGDVISVHGGTSSVESHKVTVIADDTHLTVEENWLTTSGGIAFEYGTTTDGFHVSNLANLYMANCSSREQGQWGINLVGTVFANIVDFQYTIDNPTYRSWYHIRGNGVQGTRFGSTPSGDTTDIVFHNLVANTYRNYGAFFDQNLHRVAIFGGAVELGQGPATGMRLDCDHGFIVNVDGEANTNGTDFDIRGFSNTLETCSSGTLITLTVNSQFNEIRGGQQKQITNVGFRNTFKNCVVNLGAGTITDTAGTDSVILNCYTASAPIPNKFSGALNGSFDESGAQPINAAKGDSFFISATGNLTIQNPINGGKYQKIRLVLYAGGAGNWNYTWNNKWNAKGSLTLPAVSGATGTQHWIEAVYNWSFDTWDVINAQ